MARILAEIAMKFLIFSFFVLGKDYIWVLFLTIPWLDIRRTSRNYVLTLPGDPMLLFS